MRRTLVGVVAATLLPVGQAMSDELLISPNDPREYEAFVLPNGMKVLLVSDAEADKAAAAVDVLVGSAADPEGREGMAHFLEHMLFLGTEKYPEVGEYQQFIAAHGGHTNAYTAFENTNYFFDVDPEHLEPALDRFAQFFVAPLFSPEYVVQERNIIQSEYEAHRREEGWRLLHAFKQVVHPEHPYSRFNVGSLETLADRDGSDVREEMIAFYRQHYTPELMTLAVLGPQSLETLRGWVEDRFIDVPATGAQRSPIDVPLFSDGALPARLDIEPLREARTLTLRFPVPPVREHYTEDPLGYIAQLLGHEGPGSLLSALRQLGWAESVVAGMGVSNFDHAAFDVRIGLTRDGLDQVEAIVALVFDQIDRIRRDGVSEARFRELQQVSELAFRFQERSAPMRYASSLARSMQIYPLHDTIRGPYAMDHFAPGLIANYLDRFRPDNLLLMVVAPEVEPERTEPWFGAGYRLRALDPAAIGGWQADPDALAALQLPEPNPFLPHDLALRDSSASSPRPEIVVDEPGFTLWYRQDVEFAVPRATLYISVRSPQAMNTARDAVLADLYVAMVNDELNEFAYPARLAGLDYRVYPHSRGLTVRITGYNDGQLRFAEEVLRVLRAPAIGEGRFERRREETRRELANSAQRVPHRQAMAEIQRLLVVPSWSDAERLAEIDRLGVAELREFVDAFWAGTELVALAHGNLDVADHQAFAELIRTRLRTGSEPVSVPRARVVDVSDGRRRVRQLDLEHHDSALALYIQGASGEYAERARLLVLGQMLGPRFFRELRTEQQTGYVVYASYMPILEVPGLVFVAQSNAVDPTEIESRVAAFTREQAAALAELDDEEFERHRAAVLTRVLEREQRLGERSERYWVEIDRGNVAFDSRERIAAELRALQREAVVETYSEAVAGRGGGWMVVRSVGTGHALGTTPEDAGTEYIDDPAAFQSTRALLGMTSPASSSGPLVADEWTQKVAGMPGGRTPLP